MEVLTAARLREVFDYSPETGLFLWRVPGKKRRVGEPAGSKTRKGYVRLSVDLAYLSAHRAAWLYVYGEYPKGQIDHINRIRTDNRIENLRVVSSQGNNRNRAPEGTGATGVKGVVIKGNRFAAQIRMNYKTVHLGYFDTVDQAAAARRDAETRLWGTV